MTRASWCTPSPNRGGHAPLLRHARIGGLYLIGALIMAYNVYHDDPRRRADEAPIPGSEPAAMLAPAE
jgi:cbb3-type cytochrome oxidase subunit 1